MINLDWAKCGTASNYRAHHRRGEKPCEACRLANNRQVQESRQRLAARYGVNQSEYRRLFAPKRNKSEASQ